MSDVHSAVGAYVVDALEDDERVEFENHLAGCPSCQFEAAEFTETVAELGPLLAARPPLALRASVMTAIAGTRQLPRERVARGDDRPRPLVEGGEEAPRRLRVASVTELRPPEPPDEVAPLEEHPSVVPDTPWLGITASLSEEMEIDRDRDRDRGRRDRVLALLVAAALVMAVVFSGWVYISWQHEQTQMAEAQRETNLLTAPNVEVYGDTVKGAAVSFVVSKDTNQALFIAQNLPNPPRGSVYQLWNLSGDVPRPDSLIRNGGTIRQWFVGPIGSSDSVAITLEPAPDGSDQPTTTLLARAEFS